MSHLHERQEKICLNCGTALTGRYCPNCGQENVEPKESFWHLLGHFFEDLTHFDGKFFVTIKYLLFRPGYLTGAYIHGKRASYLNPIRMYLFISAMYFLLLMSFFINAPGNLIQSTTKNKNGNTVAIHGTRNILDSLDKNSDTIFKAKTIEQYDSIQNALPPAKRDGWLQKAITRKGYQINEKDKENSSELWHGFKEKFYHSMPYMLFISVPLIALLLKLLYVRRKQFFYVSHVIFAIHFYCLVFIAFIVVDSLNLIGGWANYIAAVIKLAYVVYLYIAMLNFYKQGWFKTFAKFLLLIFLGSTILFTLAGFFAIAAIWKLV